MARYILCPASWNQDPVTGVISCPEAFVQHNETIHAQTVDDQIDAKITAFTAATSEDLSLLDSTLATGLYTGGFMLVFMPWAAAYGISKLIDFIRTV